MALVEFRSARCTKQEIPANAKGPQFQKLAPRQKSHRLWNPWNWENSCKRAGGWRFAIALASADSATRAKWGQGPMRKLGFWSAMGVFAIGLAYLVTLSFGIARAGLSRPIVDPILAVMEVLTIVSACLLVVVMAALHSCRPVDRQIYSRLALVFMALMAGLTMSVHFVELTALRQMGSAGLAWPSVPYAIELLAWDILLGISLLFAGLSMHAAGREKMVRLGMFLVGSLCLAGASGPITADMRLQFIAVFGYAAGLPVLFLALAHVFKGLPNH